MEEEVYEEIMKVFLYGNRDKEELWLYAFMFDKGMLKQIK